MITEQEVEVLAMQTAHMSIRDKRMEKLIGHLHYEDAIRVLHRRTEIARVMFEDAAAHYHRTQAALNDPAMTNRTIIREIVKGINIAKHRELLGDEFVDEVLAIWAKLGGPDA